MYGYFYFSTPDLFKTFDKYGGLLFDYKLEEDSYKDKLYYKQLNEEEAMNYRGMYHAAINGETNYSINVSKSVNEGIDRALFAFSCDFPEYYWYSYTLNSDSANVKDKFGLFDRYYHVVSFDSYDFDIKDLPTYIEQIENKLNEIIPLVKADDDYTTIKNVFDYLVNNVTYSDDTREKQDIRAALLDGEAVCNSYAASFQLICNRLGYECYNVQGETIDFLDEEDSTPELHAWNVINIDGKWYWVDVTWGDYDEEYVNSKGKKVNRIDYSYFLAPDKFVLLDHTPDSAYEYPECSDDSYYLNDKSVYLESFDEEKISELIINAFKNKYDEFTFHFDKKEDADLLSNWLDSDAFFDIYENNISKIYNGTYNWFYSPNYSISLEWSFR